MSISKFRADILHCFAICVPESCYWRQPLFCFTGYAASMALMVLPMVDLTYTVKSSLLFQHCHVPNFSASGLRKLVKLTGQFQLFAACILNG